MPELPKTALVIRDARFLTSVADYRKLPLPQRQEITFVGRSNVGKSSLINTILGRKKLALISGKPGKTRLVNYFLINNEFYLVDLPGYGFARVSGEQRRSWTRLLEGYLTSPRPRLIFLLLDARSGPTRLDLQMAEWLHNFKLPCVVTATKVDKLSRGQWEKNHRRQKELLTPLGMETIIPFSAVDGRGIREIHDLILRFLSGELPASAP